MGGENRSLNIAIVLVVGLAIAQIGVSTIPSAEDKNTYVSAHNVVRAQKGLPPLMWNDTLAQYADKWVQERSKDCIMQHSNCDGDKYGENIAMCEGPDISIAESVRLWAAEEAYYNYDTNTCLPDKMCGHYTQVVWRSTAMIGCACSKCKNGGSFISCNYCPPGNYLGKKPY